MVMRNGFCGLIGVFIILGIGLFSGQSLALDNSLLQCWDAGALKGKAFERRARRSGRRGIIFIKDNSWSARPVPAHLSGSIRRVELPPGVKLVALTFDLCEGSFEIAGYDGGVIDYLRANKIKATLFVGGKWLESHKERAAQLIADPLFEIGNHSWSHKNLRRISDKSLISEIEQVQFAYARAYDGLLARGCMRSSGLNFFSQKFTKPRQLTLFRFPFGTCNAAALRAVSARGLLAIQWDVVTGDPAFGQSARRVANVVLRNTKPGSIIIAHANGRGHHTAKALPLIIPKLIAKGYRFVTVSELLAAGKPVIAKSCALVTIGIINCT